MSRKPVLMTTALAAVLVLGVVEPSFAASDIGKNVGSEVTSWAQGLLLGVAALVALPALARRDIGQGVVIVLLVVLLGGMAYAGGTVKSTITSMWETVGRSSNPADEN